MSTDLILEDWKITKDRIKHFDDVVIRLRLQGIPIATAILAMGLASFEYTHNIKFLGINTTSLIVALGALYLLPVFFLDMLHYKLLLISVKHGQLIEAIPKYKGKLQITTKLTSPKLTTVHTICAIVIYICIIVCGFVLAYYINTLPTNRLPIFFSGICLET